MSQLERSDYLAAFGVPAFLYVESTDAIEVSTQKICTPCLVIETDDKPLLINNTVLASYCPSVCSKSRALIVIHLILASEILVNETFKREAWEVLKQLQQCLK
jgi:hypothetical protein